MVYGILNQRSTCKGVVCRILGCVSEGGFAIINAVNILGIGAADKIIYVERSAVMDINSIPFERPV